MLSQISGGTLYKVMPAFCGSAFMLYVYDAGVLGGIQSTVQFLDAIGNPNGVSIIPIIASIYNLAAAAMSLAIIVGRIICGCGIGCIASAVPNYMAEMSLQARERGPEICWQQALLITGAALAYWIDFGFVQGLERRPYLWHVPIAMQACFAIFWAGGLLFLHDTPRWYCYRNRIPEADAVLARLQGLPKDHPMVQAQKNEVLASINEENYAKFNLLHLFWDNSDYQVGRHLRTSFLILFA
ncbi:hypothetical protein PMIN04_005660 [Paraphaeosphaeria minitans]